MARRIMSMKISNDTIGNQTRDLPACSAVPQPTAPLHAPIYIYICIYIYIYIYTHTQTHTHTRVSFYDGVMFSNI